MEGEAYRMIIDLKLKEWATPRQTEYLDAVTKHGSHRKAAKGGLGLVLSGPGRVSMRCLRI